MSKNISPLPWFSHRVGSSTVYIESRLGRGMLQEVAACGPTEAGSAQQAANAAFIVKAVNTHDALIAAAKRASAAIGNLGHAEGGLSGRDELDKASDDLDAAISAAEGK